MSLPEGIFGNAEIHQQMWAWKYSSNISVEGQGKGNLDPVFQPLETSKTSGTIGINTVTDFLNEDDMGELTYKPTGFSKTSWGDSRPKLTIKLLHFLGKVLSGCMPYRCWSSGRSNPTEQMNRKESHVGQNTFASYIIILTYWLRHVTTKKVVIWCVVEHPPTVE